MQVGKYQLVRKLATGGMAEVFLAKAAGPMGFEKTLVLKRILPHLAEEPSFVEMFLSEAKLAAQLTHPNVVQIFDFGESEGAYFLAMEYIDGPNLRVLVKRARGLGLALPPAVCARLIVSACEGLAFAHDFCDPATGQPLGLIHRDISPDNIILSRQGAVKVVDFGIAKAAGQSHKTQSGVIKGKLAYMPPEQLRAWPLDRRVDVYALGVVFYELLTGHKPFEAPTEASLMQTILFEAPVPAVRHRPDLPEAVQRILDRVLAKDREQRYPDCLALQADLEDFIHSVGRPVSTQQIAQLVAQVSVGTDAPVPTPQPGTPPEEAKHSVTPVHTPAPPSGVGTAPGVPQPARPVRGSTLGEMRAPVETAPVQAVESKTEPHVVPSRVVKSEQRAAPEPTRRLGWMLPAASSAVLLAAGGGYLFWRTSAEVEQAVPPVSAPAATPVVVTPEPVRAAPPHTEVADSAPGSSGVTEGAPPPSPPSASPSQHQDKSAAVVSRDTEKTTPEKAAPPPAPGEARTVEPSTAERVSSGERPPVRPATRPVVGKGKLEFRIRPYAIVFVDGKRLGETPLSPVELSAGRHSVRFVNSQLDKDVTRSIEVKAGQSTLFKLNLEAEE
jgi:serine/threonine-protein kinase